MSCNLKQGIDFDRHIGAKVKICELFCLKCNLEGTVGCKNNELQSVFTFWC
jgi:hypothetical protein